MSLLPLDQAKRAISIPEAWRRLGLPGNPKKSCRSPFRQEKSPSFSVFEDSGVWLWKDFAQNQGGDVVSFVAQAKNCGQSDAAKWLIDQAGQGFVAKPQIMEQESESKKSGLIMPTTDRGTYSDVVKLQKLRDLPMNAGVEILLNRGLLRFCDIPDVGRCWIVFDSSYLNAQVRTLDGSLIHGKLKAKSLKGSQAGRAIGIQEAQRFKSIWIVEGTPDLLAASTMAFMQGKTSETGFVCITGASNQIHGDDLPAFTDKHVTIFGHHDQNGAGQEAAKKWARQIGKFAKSVKIMMPEKPGDLNDIVSSGFFEQESPDCETEAF